MSEEPIMTMSLRLCPGCKSRQNMSAGQRFCGECVARQEAKNPKPEKPSIALLPGSTTITQPANLELPSMFMHANGVMYEVTRVVKSGCSHTKTKKFSEFADFNPNFCMDCGIPLTGVKRGRRSKVAEEDNKVPEKQKDMVPKSTRGTDASSRGSRPADMPERKVRSTRAKSTRKGDFKVTGSSSKKDR